MFTVDLKFVKKHDDFAKLSPPRAKLKCKLDCVPPPCKLPEAFSPVNRNMLSPMFKIFNIK